MAADVSTLVRILNGYLDEQTETGRNSSNSHDLITRDLFSGGGGGGGGRSGGTSSSSRISSSKDVDLDLQVPSGWEKRLDLQSGKVYLQRCKTPQTYKQDLNYPPTKASTSSPSAAVLEEDKEKSLDLKLVPSYDYRSVCTLDKVKSALERAGKEDLVLKKRSSSSTTSGSSSIRDEDGDGDEGRSSSLSGGLSGGGSYSSSGLLFAGGCPSCLMYVMISKMNPKCPRCDSIVPTPPSMVNKKPKIDLDLNLNLMSSSW